MIVVLAAWLVAVSAQAQPFFEGKTITVLTSTGVGRQLRHHRAADLASCRASFRPSNMIVQNMPAAATCSATNHLYTIAPRDGTMIATLHNAIPLHQVLDGRGVRYDASKFNWLGSDRLGKRGDLHLAHHRRHQYRAGQQKEVILGGTGAGSGIVIIPTAMNNLLGTKFKMVMGYKSSEDLNLAIQRGEVEARRLQHGLVNGQRADWVKEKKINFIAQAGRRIARMKSRTCRS
jgi:hypothetical protein